METQITENKVSIVAPPSQEGSAFTAAYEKRLAEIKAVKDDDLVALNLDLHAVVATVLGALPEIRALGAQMAKLPNLNQSMVDGLEDYAEAAAEAHSRYVTATTPGQDIIELNQAAEKVRDQFRSDAIALTGRGLIDPARLAALKGLKGYKNVAFELLDWANLLNDCWQTIQGKTAISLQEIVNAKQLGERLVRAAGLREQAPAAIIEVARIRQQALTLLVNAYDEVRRGISFLRWKEDDVETIAPSLYGGRTRRPAAQAADNPTPQPASGPPEPVKPGTGGAVQPAAPAVPVAPGMPGANPFMA